MKRKLLSLLFLLGAIAVSYSQNCNIGNEDSTQLKAIPP